MSAAELSNTRYIMARFITIKMNHLKIILMSKHYKLSYLIIINYTLFPEAAGYISFLSNLLILHLLEGDLQANIKPQYQP